MEQLLNFVARLHEQKIHFMLGCVRDAIMVTVPTPSKYYEVEFFADGHLEVQTFGPAGDVRCPSLEEISREAVTAVNGE